MKTGKAINKTGQATKKSRKSNKTGQACKEEKQQNRTSIKIRIATKQDKYGGPNLLHYRCFKKVAR